MERRHTYWFANTAGVVLFATGAAKVYSSFGDAKLMALPDPILGFPFRNLMLLVGAMELVVALVCLIPRVNLKLKIGLVACLATNFLIYRVGLWCINWYHPCSCMGSLAAAIHLSDQAADRIMKGVLVYLLVGSYVLLLRGLPIVQKASSHSHIASMVSERGDFSAVALALCMSCAFYFIILGPRSPSNSHRGSGTLQFDPPVLDLGRISQNQKIRRNLKLVNAGTREARILSIKSTCNCTTSDESIAGKAIPAQGFILIPVEYDSRTDEGAIGSSVKAGVEVAGKKYYVETRLQGQITADFAIVPRSVDFGRLKPGERARKTIQIIPAESANLRIKQVRSSPELAVSLVVDELAQTPAPPYVITVTYEAPELVLSQTVFDGTVEIETSSKFVPLVKVPAQGAIIPDVEITPQLIVLPSPQPSGESRIIARTREPSRMTRLFALTSQGYEALSDHALTGVLDERTGSSHVCTFKNLSLVGVKRLGFEFEIRNEAGRTETRSASVEIKRL